MTMVFSWFNACLLATTVVYVRSGFKEDVCTLLRESNGLIPPPLPRNFEAKSEHIDNDNDELMYTETYLDYTNTRGKFVYLEKGIEHHSLYDYETQQIVEWAVKHPGLDVKKDPLYHTCFVTEMEDDRDIYLFGYTDASSKRPKMYNAYEMMRYGGQYQFAYRGKDRMEHRGLVVDKFAGCLYDQDMGASLVINISFTNDAVLTSGGTSRRDVLGVDDGYLSVPVRSDYTGALYDDSSKQYLPLNKTEHFFWFKGEPEFRQDIFKIPPYVYCLHYKGRKEMHPFPLAFSTRLQRTDVARDTQGKMVITEVASYEEVYYYKEKGLARRDFTPNPDLDSDIKSKFQSLAPVRTVYDFTEGIVYVTNVPTGRCYSRRIMFGDFFESSNNTMFIEMAKPEEIFFMQTDEMEYKGTDFARDIECDVFTGKYFDKRFNASFVKETYISTNGWHEDSDEVLEFGIPVQHTMINEELAGEPVEVISTYNFLKFKAAPPRLQDFDISNCIETIYHKDFVLFLAVSNEVKETLFQYKQQFVETAQYYLSSVSQVTTPLRVQRVKLTELSISDKRTVLHFSLVDKTPLNSIVPVGQSGASLDEAIAILQGFIDRNQFTIQFYPPGTGEATSVSARKGSLYIKIANGQLQAPLPEKTTLVDPVIRKIPEIQFDESIENEKKRGMTTGGLTGLAFAMLFIGFGIGIAVMYLYIRYRSDSKKSDKIKLAPKVSYTSDGEGECVVDTTSH